MSRIFLSHSSANNAEAIAVRDWMARQGWQDVFLDLDPDRGLKAGQRWQDALKRAAERCELVVFLVSPVWASSKWCLAEFLLAKNLNKRIFAAIVQPTPFEALPDEMTAEWQVVDLTAGTRDYKTTVTLPPGNATASVEFGNDGLHRLRTGLKAAGLDPSYFAWPPEDDPDRSPYPGLRALEAEDAGIFFGREAPTILALDRLRGLRDAAPPRLLVIQGSSGGGKSSFLRAGLIPRLKRDDAHFLPLPIVRPEMAVISGASGLTQAIEAAFKAQGRPLNRGDIAASIEGGAPGLLDLLSRLVDSRGGPEEKTPPSLVLSIDQGEELFLAEGAKEARIFLALLKQLALASTLNLIILFTIRSDSYELLQTAPELEGVRQETFPLPPMPSGAFKPIIERPAQRLEESGRRRLKIDPALTDQLLEDIAGGGAKDALPLLAFTLERLYRDYGADGDLTLDEYKTKLRGIEGSIQAAVDAALRTADADPTIPRDRAARMALLRRAIIPALARIDTETRTSRRRVARLAEIPQESRPLIECLVEARLLVKDETTEGNKRETTLEPAHEALLRQWSELQTWLKEETAELLSLAGVLQAAQEWTDKGRPAGWLNHSAGRLEDAERLRERKDFVRFFTPVEQAYLRACRVQENERRNRELEAQKRAARNARIGMIVASILLLFAAGTALYAFQQRSEALEQKKLANDQADEAERQTQIARQNAAEAEKQKEAAEIQTRRQLAAQLAAQSKVNLDLHAPHNILLALESISIGTLNPIESTQLLTDLLSETGGAPLAHADKVSAVEFSPDDRGVATLSGGKVQLWDSKARGNTPEQLRADAPIRGFAFSADGRMLATAGDGAAVSLWNVANPASPARSLPTDGGPWDRVSFSKDGRWLAAASHDGKRAQLWQLSADNAQPASWILPHDGAVNCLAFSADGKWLATGDEEGSVKTWNLSAANPSEAVTEVNTGDNVLTVAFSPDGQWVASGGTEKYLVHLWRTSAPERKFAMHVNQHVRALAFSPDNRWLATPSQYDAILWDLSKPDPSQNPMTLPGHRNTIADVSFSPDGTWFASSSHDNTVRLWNIRDRTPSAILRGHEAPISKLAFSHDGRRLASASDDATVRLWSVASPNALPVILRVPEGSGKLYAFSLNPDERTSPPRLLMDQEYPVGSATIVSPDGNWVAQLAKVDGLQQVDLISTSGARHHALRHPGTWAAPVFSQDSRWLATGGWNDASIRLWDVKTTNPAEKPVVLRGPSYIRSLDFSGGRHLASGARYTSGQAAATTQIWQLTDNGQVEKRTSLASGDAKSVAISPDGRFVVTGSWAPDNVIEGNDARIWDLSAPATPKSLAVFSFKNRVFDVDISADSRWAAAGSWDGTSQLLNLTKSDPKPFTLGGHTGRMITIAFSPDNHWLATANDDRSLRLWSLDLADPSSSAVVLKADFGLGVSFSPDGRWVATSQTEYRTNLFTPDSQTLISSSAQIHLHPTRLDDLVALACRTAGKRAFASEADKSLYSKHCQTAR